MTTTKIVCRLLDASGALLGWTAVQAEIRGDGKIWSPGPVVIRMDSPGVPTTLSMHWCDLHTETRVPVPTLGARARGDALTVFAQSAPMIVVGEPPGPLPAVTVGSVAIGVPVGQMGARGLG